MLIAELDTFVKKFHQLWNYGIQHTAEVIAENANGVDQIKDEFCRKVEYSEHLLCDENSVNYRFIIKDPALTDIEDFNIKVRQSFKTLNMNITNQLFKTSELLSNLT